MTGCDTKHKDELYETFINPVSPLLVPFSVRFWFCLFDLLQAVNRHEIGLDGEIKKACHFILHYFAKNMC